MPAYSRTLYIILQIPGNYVHVKTNKILINTNDPAVFDVYHATMPLVHSMQELKYSNDPMH
jgi:hypothetical protein